MKNLYTCFLHFPDLHDDLHDLHDEEKQYPQSNDSQYFNYSIKDDFSHSGNGDTNTNKLGAFGDSRISNQDLIDRQRESAFSEGQSNDQKHLNRHTNSSLHRENKNWMDQSNRRTLDQSYERNHANSLHGNNNNRLNQSNDRNRINATDWSKGPNNSKVDFERSSTNQGAGDAGPQSFYDEISFLASGKPLHSSLI